MTYILSHTPVVSLLPYLTAAVPTDQSQQPLHYLYLEAAVNLLCAAVATTVAVVD